jgi:hypothetical protein
MKCQRFVAGAYEYSIEISDIMMMTAIMIAFSFSLTFIISLMKRRYRQDWKPVF